MYVSPTLMFVAGALYMVAATVGALTVALFAAGRISSLRAENSRLRTRLGEPVRYSLAAELDEEEMRLSPERFCSRTIVPVLAVIAVIALAPDGARAQAAPRPAEAAADSSAENAALYCRNIADAAADARFSRQQSALAAMEKDIEARIAQLEAKRAEYQDWLQRRETFLKKADDSLIAVISQMRPDAAAAQMAAMHEDMAAAVLAKLSPRVASAILNEIDPARAARLTSTMVGMARRAQDGRPG